MKLAWASTVITMPSYRKRSPVAPVTSRQNTTVEMPMMTPGVSTGDTTTR